MSGTSLDPETFHDNAREAYYGSTAQSQSYNNLPGAELARRLGQAELDNDQTGARNIGDALMDRLSANAERHKMSSDTKDALLNRYLKIAEQYKDTHRQPVGVVTNGVVPETVVESVEIEKRTQGVMRRAAGALMGLYVRAARSYAGESAVQNLKPNKQLRYAPSEVYQVL